MTGSLSYSWNGTQSERQGQVTDPFKTDINRDLKTLAALARISHQFRSGEAYLRPTLDAGVTHLMVDNAIESGGGPTSLVLEADNETHVWLRPSVQFGNLHTFESGLTLHLYAELGLQYYLTDEHTEVIAGFTGAPAGVSPMVVPIDLGSYAHGTIGVELINSKRGSLALEYGKVIDENYDIDHWNLRLNVPF